MTPPPDTCRLVGPAEESRILRRVHTRVALATIRAMLSKARLRVALVAALSALFWASLWLLFREAFAFVDSLHAEVVPLLFNAFFSSLSVMFVLSTGILLYSGLYCSPEARLLLTLPVRPATILEGKFREALWFSGWGFVLLGSPMLVAYGMVRQAPWTYYLLLLPLMVSFVSIPATVGGILCMVLVATVPRLRLHLFAVAAAAAVAGIGWLGWRAVSAPRAEALSPAWFDQALASLSVTEQRLLPSWWLSSAILDAAARPREGAAGGPLVEAVLFLVLLVSWALALGLLARAVADRLHRPGFGRLVAEAPTRRKRRRTALVDEIVAAAGTRAGRPLRLLVVKDLRIFRRDASQWAQFLVFFALLALYFRNIRVFEYHHAYAAMIGFLNLAVVGLIFSTFTTRFVFPGISLEGRRFWILGLLPIGRDRIVWSKFVFAFVGGVVPCCVLVAISDAMLGVAPWIVALHETGCVALVAGLCGIAVGLGACLPDLREPSAAKIAAGFGGTLCLVSSALFIIASVLAVAVPVHFRLAADDRSGTLRGWETVDTAVVGGVAATLALAALATAVPMVSGLRAFRRLEP